MLNKKLGVSLVIVFIVAVNVNIELEGNKK